MATPLYRGSGARAVASSLIVPINDRLLLRGPLGVQLQSVYGPGPQNALLQMGVQKPGEIVTINVTPPLPGLPARWVCAVSYPWAPAPSPTWVANSLGGIVYTYREAISTAQASGQFPCAVPFFADLAHLISTQPCAKQLAEVMVANTPGENFFFITDLPQAFEALTEALAARAGSVPAEAVEVEEPPAETVVATPQPEVTTQAAMSPTTKSSNPAPRPQQRGGRPRKSSR